MPVAIARNIGRHRGGPRLWIETEALAEAGFPRGALYTLWWRNDTTMVLDVDTRGKRIVSGKTTSSGRALPIIDLNGRTLGALGAAARVTIILHPHQIIIKPETAA